METNLAGLRTFPFTYNDIENANPNLGYNFQAFTKGEQVAVEFQMHARDFTKKKPEFFQRLYLSYAERILDCIAKIKAGGLYTHKATS